jgi:uncharacterized membrane protein YhaH (DUF805 family)
MSNNPYSPPRAAVSDIDAAQEYQEIRMWSASGRLGRLRYLAYTTGASLVAGVIAGLLVPVLGPSLGMGLMLLVYVVVIVFSVLVAIQRSHDMDWSGWTILLAIIPFVGLIWLFKPGSGETNQYGAPPPPNTLGVKILGLLLPILAVVGIVAAVAIPAYVEYTKRAAGG